MKLSKICEEIEYTLLQGSLETEVRDIIYDSRKIAPETMFVCMVGAVTDGHKYIPDAVEKEASVIVLEKEEEAAQIPENITVLKVESARLALALMSAALFDHPARKLVTIGLTGTKGKTTTTYMIKKVLEMAGKKVGLIGTIGAMIGEEHPSIKKYNTGILRITPHVCCYGGGWLRVCRDGSFLTGIEIRPHCGNPVRLWYFYKSVTGSYRTGRACLI